MPEQVAGMLHTERTFRTLLSRGTRPPSMSSISPLIAISALQKRSSSPLLSLSVGSIIRVPARVCKCCSAPRKGDDDGRYTFLQGERCSCGSLSHQPPLHSQQRQNAPATGHDMVGEWKP